MTKKPVKLKNIYQNDIVYCDDMNDIVKDNEYTFLKVYKKEQPNRVYLANKEAFTIEKK